MTPVWHSILQQVVFFAGLFALTFAALEEAHLTPDIELNTKVLFAQIHPANSANLP